MQTALSTPEGIPTDCDSLASNLHCHNHCCFRSDESSDGSENGQCQQTCTFYILVGVPKVFRTLQAQKHQSVEPKFDAMLTIRAENSMPSGIRHFELPSTSHTRSGTLFSLCVRNSPAH